MKKLNNMNIDEIIEHLDKDEDGFIRFKPDTFKRLMVKYAEDKPTDRLIEVLMHSVTDLTMMSKIELGDDVITEIQRLQKIINQK